MTKFTSILIKGNQAVLGEVESQSAGYLQVLHCQVSDYVAVETRRIIEIKDLGRKAALCRTFRKLEVAYGQGLREIRVAYTKRYHDLALLFDLICPINVIDYKEIGADFICSSPAAEFTTAAGLYYDEGRKFWIALAHMTTRSTQRELRAELERLRDICDIAAKACYLEDLLAKGMPNQREAA